MGMRVHSNKGDNRVLAAISKAVICWNFLHVLANLIWMQVILKTYTEYAARRAESTRDNILGSVPFPSLVARHGCLQL
jgi:hypothetical protein